MCIVDKSRLLGTLPQTPKTFTKIILYEYDLVVADKGYSFVRKRKFKVITPVRCNTLDEFLEKKLNSLNANKSRLITALRNVVEHSIGMLKLQFRRLGSKLNGNNIPSIYKVLQILASIRNYFFKPLRSDNIYTTAFALEYSDRLSTNPSNQSIRKYYENNKIKGWKRIPEKGFKGICEYFRTLNWLPELTEQDLQYLLLGNKFTGFGFL